MISIIIIIIILITEFTQHLAGPERLSHLPKEPQLAHLKPGLDPYALAHVLNDRLLLLNSGELCDDPREGGSAGMLTFLLKKCFY